MQALPGAPAAQAAAPKPARAAGAPPAIPAHSFSPTPSSLLLPTPLSMKPLASPEQATLAFAPAQWAPASAATPPSAAAQGRSTGPPTGAAAAAQDMVPVNGGLHAATGLQERETEQQAQPAVQPDAPGDELAHAAANGSAPLEPILRALEMLGTLSQQQAEPKGQPEMPAPPVPPRLATSRGERSGRSSSTGPASNAGRPPPGIATVTTGPFGSSGLGDTSGSGLLTPRAPPPAIPPLSTPAAAGGVRVVPSSAEPTPLALPALVAAGAAAEAFAPAAAAEPALDAAGEAAEAAAPAAAAKSRRRAQQQRQQKQQAAEAAARPPRPAKGKQAKRRGEQPDGQQDQQEPPKRQRQRNSKIAAAAAATDTEQRSADAPVTPSALPSDPRLPLYDSSSAQGPFHYAFGRSLLFELPPPTPPLELPNFRTAAPTAAPPRGSVAAAAAPPPLQQARTRPQPAVTAAQQAAGLVKAEAAEPPSGATEAGAGQKRKRQRQRAPAGKVKDEEAAAEFAPFAVSAPADNKEAPFSMRSIKFKGVYRMPNGRWRAQFTHRNKVIQIGMYDSEEEAARAWDKAAIQYRGLGTKINIPVSQATMAEWAKDKPVGWSLFYDDNDQPLPQPLAGAALQAKQRELQQKAAAEGKVKQEGKAVAAAPVASSPGAVAGGKRAAGKQQGGKAAAAAGSPKAAAAGKRQEQGATPSLPGSPTAAGAAGTAREAAHPAAASARLTASPQPQPQGPKPRASAAASASAPSPAPAATPAAGPSQAVPAAAPPATPEAAAAGVAAASTPAAGMVAAAGQPAISPLLPIPAAQGPAASGLATAQPASRTVVVHPAWGPGPLAQGQPAIAINQVAPPVLVTSQRFLPASTQQAAASGGSSRGAAPAERGQPKAPAAAKPKPSRKRERAPKRARQEEGSGRKPAQAAGAAGGGSQRAQRARRPAVRTLETVGGSDFTESESEEPGAASRARRGGAARQRSRQQRGLDSSLIAAVAAAEAAEMAAAARQNGGASQLQLPPVATGTPAAAAAAAELGTPTGIGAAGSPLSPGRPPHRSRKKAAHPAAEAFAFNPFLEIEVPAPLQDSWEAEEEWGGEEGMAVDGEEWDPQAGRRRKQAGRSGQPRGLHSAAAPSAPAQPPPLTMKLRGWSAKRQRTTPDSH